MLTALDEEGWEGLGFLAQAPQAVRVLGEIQSSWPFLDQRSELKFFNKFTGDEGVLTQQRSNASPVGSTEGLAVTNLRSLEMDILSGCVFLA